MKGEMEPIMILVLVLILVLSLGIYIFSVQEADLPSSVNEISEYAPAATFAVANRDDVIVKISWKGPVRNVLTKKDEYMYDVEISNLKLDFYGDTPPINPIHPILTIKGIDVKDLPGEAVSLQIKKEDISEIIEYPDIKIEGIVSERSPNTIEKDDLSFNKEIVILNFWEETTCFNMAYKTGPQLPNLVSTCCKKYSTCDWRGSALLENNYYIYAPGVVTGKIIYDALKDYATFDKGTEKTLEFSIQNTGNVAWETGDELKADDNLILLIEGCKNPETKEITTQRYQVTKIAGKVIYPNGRITSADLGGITCVLPDKREDVKLVLYANCYSDGGYADKNPPCSNENGVVPLDEICPFLSNGEC